MGAGNYSVEASIIENGKLVKGTLTLFKDEYVFGGKRTSVNWENVICERGTETIKAFLRTVEKPYVAFNDGQNKSTRFILESPQMRELLGKVEKYAEATRNEQREKEEKARKAAEEKQRQLDWENRIREEARLKAEEEYRRKKE